MPRSTLLLPSKGEAEDDFTLLNRAISDTDLFQASRLVWLAQLLMSERTGSRCREGHARRLPVASQDWSSVLPG